MYHYMLCSALPLTTLCCVLEFAYILIGEYDDAGLWIVDCVDCVDCVRWIVWIVFVQCWPLQPPKRALSLNPIGR